ncbi:MAG TPA: class I SAM-dependent methyltransferase [Candidatus Saccharimonadales bacterium]|jgi:SAM-dependent methyltransferase|nr:class I SAM-dependent methyltransferase [Candidatus Saccharimonadales bacterium]
MGEVHRFDKAAEHFTSDHYATVRGRVRQDVTRYNLQEHLLDIEHLEVLDFGGGDGRDAIWLASLGHNVTVIDESDKMVDIARQTLSQGEPSMRKRIKIEQGDEHSLAGLHNTFDLILSHGVLMYELEHPVSQLRNLCDVLRPGGLLSLLSKGLDAARQQAKPEDIPELNRISLNHEGIARRAYSFEQLEFMTKRIGLKTIGKYGVRVLHDNDYRLWADIPTSELRFIISNEIQAGREPSLRDMAQMLQIIVSKPGAGRLAS